MLALRLSLCLFLISGCSTHFFPQRKIASEEVGKNCHDSLRVLIDNVPQGNSLFKRRARTKMLQETVLAGDIMASVEIIKKSHDNLSEHFEIGHLIGGRSIRKEKRLRRLRKSTQTTFVPAYFQKAGGDGEDVFSTIYHVTDGRSGINSFEENAIKDVQGWIDEYIDYWPRMERLFQEGIEAKRIVDTIDSANLSKDSEGAITIRLPFFDENKNIYYEEKRFLSYDQLETYKEAFYETYVKNFAVFKTDDYFDKSAVYSEMFQQAVLFRRLELVYYRLTLIGSRSLSEEQLTLQKQIKELFEQRPDLRPRSDMAYKLQKREIRTEWKAKWSFWRSKSNHDKYPLPDSIRGMRDNVSPMALAKRYGSFFAAASILGAIGNQVTSTLEEYPEYQYFMSLIGNYTNDFLLNTLGTTPALRACAKSDRAWTVNEVTMNAFIQSHTSRHFFYAKFTDYDDNLDEELKKYKHELRVLCIKKGSEYGARQSHTLNKEGMAEAYRGAVDSLFLDAISEDHEKAAQIVPLVEKLFEANWVLEDRDEENRLMGEIVAVDAEMAVVLRDYLSKVDAAVMTLTEMGSLPKSHGVDGFIETMDQRYE